MAASDSRRVKMAFEHLIGAVLSLLLTIYLVYALLRPERF
jgi:K+-transporting ATPase KdpF subunit